MRKLILAVTLVVAAAVPAVAQAQPPTPQHRAEYLHAYHAVRAQFGAHESGCNLIGKLGSCHITATDADVMKSLAVLQRTLSPPPAAAPAISGRHVTYSAPTHTTASSTASYSSSSGSSGITGGSYEACIISAESGGSASATNGQYSGIGQWSPQQWQADGGGRYSSTAGGASYAEQKAVLDSEGTAGMHAQQGRYDRCG